MQNFYLHLSQSRRQANCRSSFLPPLLQIQSPRLSPLPLATIPRGLSRAFWNTLLSSLLCMPLALPLLYLLPIPKYQLPIPILYQGPFSGHVSLDPKSISYQSTLSYSIPLRTREGNRNKGPKQPPNKEKTRYQHLEYPNLDVYMPM